MNEKYSLNNSAGQGISMSIVMKGLNCLQMCVRVNNLHELLTIWTEIRRDVCGRLSSGEKTVSDTPREKVETSGTLKPGDDCDGGGRQEVDDEDYSVDCASHLRSVIHAQVNILAYRVSIALKLTKLKYFCLIHVDQRLFFNLKS